jgi:DNA topoisomerase-1
VIRQGAHPGKGLRHADLVEPGYRRSGRGRRTHYLRADGSRVRDRAELARLRALAIPPAWTEVWITADPLAHLQATGRDSKGRKQYRYHPEWRRQRDLEKFERVLELGKRLPAIREAVAADLRRRGWRREKVLALIVRLLELTHLRPGDDAYVRLNRSYGLTTLRRSQVHVEGQRIRITFRGKGGRRHDVEVRDRSLARLVTGLSGLPGSRLFKAQGPDGALVPIGPRDLNEYLRTISGLEITAKDFRTWAGTVASFRALREEPPAPTRAASQRQLARAMGEAAERLGNTPTVARQSYVDGRLVEAWQEGDLARLRIKTNPSTSPSHPATPAEERAVVRVLSRRRKDHSEETAAMDETSD